MSVTYDSRISTILRNLPRAIDEDTKAAAEDILDLAQQLCPVDTGALRASGEVVRRGASWVVQFTMPYAAFVEFGTAIMPAQPFLTPAAREIGFNAKTVARVRKVLTG